MGELVAYRYMEEKEREREREVCRESIKDILFRFFGGKQSKKRNGKVPFMRKIRRLREKSSLKCSNATQLLIYEDTKRNRLP